MTRRRLFDITAALALLLCIAAAATWLGNRFRCDEIEYSVAHQTFFMVLVHGSFEVGWDSNYDSNFPDDAGSKWRVLDADDRDTVLDHNVIGFGVTYKTWNGATFHVVTLPDWSIILASATLFCGCVVLRGRKLSPDCCLTCGYNLTGNTSGVCPECGAPAPADIVQKSS